ncbi:hypothetical protein PV327_007891 [Microctonus hyperodae]|uniref:Uncharacterized protein n=1 Tax=Microctonus hyperodae TaxID=165561 RepID=A0AA39KZ67_MICHY|nr:hypothetical protein PV327_007891 [Microctonus hyperodae]
MESKVIIFSAVLVLMSFTNVHGTRYRRSADPQAASSSFSNANWVNDQINSIQKQIQEQQKQFQQSFGFPSDETFGNGAASHSYGFPSDSFEYQQPQQQHQQFPSFPSFNTDPFQSFGFGNPGFGGFNRGSHGLGQPGAFGQSYAFGSANAGQPGSFDQGNPSFQSRFGDISPPGGPGTYGSFSSSKSSTVIGPDGKPVTHEVITTGTNNNGKVTVNTFHNP